ncbi:hypothetical protein [Candidatus Spongiihabitans sp.]
MNDDAVAGSTFTVLVQLAANTTLVFSLVVTDGAVWPRSPLTA